MNIVSKLLEGSKNIDRKKNEILQIVAMIHWLLRDEDIRHLIEPSIGLVKRVFKMDEVEWTFVKIPADGEVHGYKGAVTVTCHVRPQIGGESKLILRRAYDFTDGKHSYNTFPVCVRMAHDSLNVFVAGMIREFPVLEERLKMIADEA
jgi:hypothetical protein